MSAMETNYVSCHHREALPLGIYALARWFCSLY